MRTTQARFHVSQQQPPPLEAATRAHNSMRYSPPLDGVRALAIVAVVGFHLLPHVLKGGFTGVDVFFVLSGYLISSVILHDIRNNKFSMTEFYLRRVQRLLPNAVLMISATLAVSAFLLLPSMTKALAAHGLWALLNLSNFYILKTVGGYWGNAASSAPLLHTWSLAVEEQFYLAFPLTLVLLARRKSLFTITISLTVVSFLLCAYATRGHQSSAFYLLPTRAWEPLLGAVLAVYRVPLAPRGPTHNASPQWLLELTGWAGLALIVAGFFFVTDGRRFPGVVALVPALGTLALLVSIVDGTTTVARIFSASIFVQTGRVSYSLYLWHWPLIVIGGTYATLLGISAQVGRLTGLSIAIVIAILAYRFVEQPMRKRGAGRKRLLIGLAAAFFLALLACLTLSLRQPTADPLGRFDRPTFFGLLYNAGDAPTDRPQSATRYYDVLFPERPPQPQIWQSGGIVHNWGSVTPRVVVLGSSHALMYGRLIDDICRQQGISVAFLSADATTVLSPLNVSESFPTPTLAAAFDIKRKSWIAEWHPDAVFVIDRWDSYASDQAAFYRRLHSLVGDIAPHTHSVILVSQPPVLKIEPGVNLREYASWSLNKLGHLPTISPDENEPIRKSSIGAMRSLTNDFSNVQLLRVDPVFYNNDGSVRFISDRTFLYADDNHLTQAGAERTREIVSQAVIQSTHAGNNSRH